ncbi:MAG: hypothetical protein SFY67_07440 [Candidatus Melainabacteria bacterium]|nr:hypothetical protein [Candidatus Melainabacteria bacterium]
MSPQVQSALITAILTLAIFLCKDFVHLLWKKQGEENDRDMEKLRLYIEPLVVSAKKLFWRLDEVFSPAGRGLYLRADAADSEYVQYKKASTLYRLSSLLGWKRALRKEMSFVRTEVSQSFDKVEVALKEIEASLADGESVELQRLSNIELIWTHLIIPADRRAELAVELERLIEKIDKAEELASSNNISDTSSLFAMLPESVANLFETKLGIKTAAEIIGETRARIVNALCIRETWVYREWQEAIGDILIQETNNARRYEVLGYQKFLELCVNGTSVERFHLSRLERVIEDVDITRSSDTRVRVLWSTYISTAKLIKHLAEAFTKFPLLVHPVEVERINKIATLDASVYAFPMS